MNSVISIVIETLRGISLDQILLILNILNSTLLAFMFAYLKFGIDRRLKKYEFYIGDANELNTKTHDRLVEVEDLIQNMKIIPKELKKRLLMNSARLEKHDPKISNNIKSLINIWNGGFFFEDASAIKIEGREERTRQCQELITDTKLRIDTLVKF